jgi:hypothetical protein
MYGSRRARGGHRSGHRWQTRECDRWCARI